MEYMIQPIKSRVSKLFFNFLPPILSWVYKLSGLQTCFTNYLRYKLQIIWTTNLHFCLGFTNTLNYKFLDYKLQMIWITNLHFGSGFTNYLDCKPPLLSWIYKYSELQITCTYFYGRKHLSTI